MTILVLDIGSSSARALLFDDEANLLTQVARRHQFTTEPHGAATFDAESLRDRVEACLDEILQQPEARSIRAVAVDTFVGNLLGVDTDGQTLTPIFTYADTRSASYVAEMTAYFAEFDFHQQTGCLNHTAYHPGRFEWLRRTEPQTYQRVNQWVDFAYYLYLRWFGRAATSYSVASWSGLLNRETLAWDKNWLDRLSLDESELTSLADYDEAISGLRLPYAERWSVLRDVPFFLAVGDGAAANVGAGCIGAGQMALSLGTTAALRIASAERLPRVPDGLWSYRITRDLHLIGGATSEGGNVYEWVSQTVTLPADAEAQLAQRVPDGHGLTLLPLLAGERSPGWAAGATATIHGLRLSTDPVDVLQAALEGVALRLALISEQLGGDQPVVASGGALDASPAWAQMIADALARPLHFAGVPEITARGTAALALAALDGRPLGDFAPSIARTVEPRAAGVAALRAARERQTALYQKFYGTSD